jgi:hypothetical protein
LPANNRIKYIYLNLYLPFLTCKVISEAAANTETAHITAAPSSRPMEVRFIPLLNQGQVFDEGSTAKPPAQRNSM